MYKGLGPKDETIKDKTYISVVVPVYNDPKGIVDTLNSLVYQEYPANNFEIIVADNGSTDNTIGIINKYIDNYPHLVHLVSEREIKSSYAARNKGIESSKGSIIAFIDADMSVNKDWLHKIDQSFKEHQWDYLACAVEIYIKKKSICGIFNKMTGFPIKAYIQKDHFAPTCCLVVRRNVFDTIGQFDFRLISSGDREFGSRVYEYGYKIFFAPNILMMHPSRSSLKSLCKKAFRIGRGNFQIITYHPERFKELGKIYINPLHYMPNIPWILSLERCENKIWNELSLDNKIRIFFIEWLLRLIRNAGFFYEMLGNKRMI